MWPFFNGHICNGNKLFFLYIHDYYRFVDELSQILQNLRGGGEKMSSNESGGVSSDDELQPPNEVCNVVFLDF